MGDSSYIAVDAFRTFGSLENAIERVNLIKEYDIAFVEDPFLESEGIMAIALRDATGVPVSFGESLASSKDGSSKSLITTRLMFYELMLS